MLSAFQTFFSLHCNVSEGIPGSLAIAPCSAGRRAPSGGLFLLLKSSQISAIVTHSTPGLPLIYSMILWSKLTQCLASSMMSLFEGMYEPLQHQQNLWVTADVGMDGHRKAKVVVFSVEIIKVVTPQIFHVARIDPSVAVGHFLDEHHWRKIIQIPIGRNFNEPGRWPPFQRFHPGRRVFVIVYWNHFITSTEIVREAIMMGKAMICPLPVSQ